MQIDDDYASKLLTQVRTSKPAKRTGLFLDLITHICARLDRPYFMSYDDYDSITDGDILSDEEVYVAECRGYLRAIASCADVPEVHADLITRHLVARAALASERVLPLIGDIEHLLAVAEMYKAGIITGLARVASISAIRRDHEGRALEGATLIVRLNQNGTFSVEGGRHILHRRLATLLHTFKPLQTSTPGSRTRYMQRAVDAIKQDVVGDWRYESAIVYEGEHFESPDKYARMQAVDTFIVRPLRDTVGFYESSLFDHDVNALSSAEVNEVAGWLDLNIKNPATYPPRPNDSVLLHLLYGCEREDAYRALYLVRAQEKGRDFSQIIAELKVPER